MASEEAALRAKIQAMRNLLQAKQQREQQQQQQSSYQPYRQQYNAQRTFPTRSYHAPVNRSWNRFSNDNSSGTSSNASVNTVTTSSATPYSGAVMSANKVWRRVGADVAAKGASASSQHASTVSAAGSKTWKRPVSKNCSCLSSLRCGETQGQTNDRLSTDESRDLKPQVPVDAGQVRPSSCAVKFVGSLQRVNDALLYMCAC